MRTLPVLLIPVLLALLPALAAADTLVLRNGLSVRGRIVEKTDEVIVTDGDRTWRFDRSRVREIRRGESKQEEYARRATELEATDDKGWFRLALWARENKIPQARNAYERVVGIDPDHRAARRELGYEKVGDRWVTGDDAKRSKGFVLCAGKWMLPVEADRLMRAGLMKQPKSNEAYRRRALDLFKAMLDDDAQVRKLGASQLMEVPDAALVRPLEKALFSHDPQMRIVAVKTLSRIGDRVALPWLIRSSMFDANQKVRDTAFRAVRSFRDEDVFFPYARAMYSKSPKARIMAAKALADLDDLRGVDVILRRISWGLGASPRVNIMVGTQTSYIRDFDVEIAQSAAIGDPIVGTIRDGIILDFKILGGYGESWVVEQRRAFAGALADLTGRDYGEDWKLYEKYAKEKQLPRVRVK